MQGHTVIFDPERGVVVTIAESIPIDLPIGSRNFLNSSFPGPSMKNLEADIQTRQYGQITLLRDQKRSIDRLPHEPPINYQRDDYAEVPVMDRPFIGVVDLSEWP
jgi:hypothetical protein